MSKMRAAMLTQPSELARLVTDAAPAEAAAERLRDRRILLIGIGTSWHAAQHGAWMLREAGVAAEQSYAYTVSHTGALLRLAQIATALGARLGDLAAVPDRVAAVLDAPGPLIDPPQRLVELIGAGPNAWTA